MALIKVKDLRKVYHVDKERVVALNRINLEINKGEICCILGTSGSGKSTFLNILAGLEKPSLGSVHINGVDICQLNEKELAVFRQKNIGFVFQSYNLMTTLTAIENVAMPLMFRGMSKKKRDHYAIEMLKAVQLKSRMGHTPSQMSGGQQQRVGIARAFVARPSIIYADEPTGNLDSKTTREVMGIMIKMARRYHETLVIVTHDTEIAKYADRIIHLLDGDIKSDEPNESIIKDDVIEEKEEVKKEENKEGKKDDNIKKS